MLEKYLLVNKDVLPEVFTKVIKAKEMLESGEYSQISEVVKMVGLSRSAFYKYKDDVFVPGSLSILNRTALISLVLTDQLGVLSEVLKVISLKGANILTINQNIPINKKANVILSIDINNIQDDIKDLLDHLCKIPGVHNASLMSLE